MRGVQVGDKDVFASTFSLSWHAKGGSDNRGEHCSVDRTKDGRVTSASNEATAAISHSSNSTVSR